MSPRRGPPIKASERISVGRNNGQNSGYDSEHFSSVEEDEDVVVSNEESEQCGYSEIHPKRRIVFESEQRKGKIAVPDGAASNHRSPGTVRRNAFGDLEYWDADKPAWILAVYHHEIREKLIKRAKTNNGDVYTHPRARGKHFLDVTAFLDSQRDWDLERDHGWIGIEILYAFHKPEFQTPTYQVHWMLDEGRVVLDLNNNPVKDFRDIPLTLSSEVEGGLITLIRRVDPRIAWPDLWARLPDTSRIGGILSVPTLRERSTRWRLKNCVTAWKKRLGTEEISDFFWNRMSPAARATNSTRELSKLSAEEIEEAKSKNKFKSKHARKARGHDNRRGGAIKKSPASSRHLRNRKPRPTVELHTSRNIDHQVPSFVSKHNHVAQHQKGHEPTLGAAYTSQGPVLAELLGHAPLGTLMPSSSASEEFAQFASPPWTYENMSTGFDFTAPYQDSPPFDVWEASSSGTSRQGPNLLANGTSLASTPSPNDIDYRDVCPRNEQEGNLIDGALEPTRTNFLRRTESELPLTLRYQSYSFQLREMMEAFEFEWTWRFGTALPLPDLVWSREPWSGGFENGVGATGGDDSMA